MEWTAGIESSSNAFRAQVLNQGVTQIVDLKYLVSGGLPRERRSRTVVDGEMRDWKEADPAEYLDAFSIARKTAPNNHAVYETRNRQRRILIPALAIMRAFFRPAKYLLPRMFLPQPLDQVRFVDTSLSPPNVEFLAETLRNLGPKCGELKTPISWMSMFPSAIDFAGSVHLNARSGRIAVSFPAARVRIAFQGRRKESVLLVTNATLLGLDAVEQPIHWAANHPLKIYERASYSIPTRSPILQTGDIPVNGNGLPHLSDEEWNLIEPILFPPGEPRRKPKLSQRGLFDGILCKLILGTGWKSTRYPVGTATNVLYAYRSWTATGVLEAALAVLRNCRS